MKPIIYLDLDETLIHSTEWWDGEPPVGYDLVGFEVYDTLLSDGGWGEIEKYKTIIRPHSREFISNLKQLGFPVKICTAATLDYALGICNQADFGIPQEDIIDRYQVQHLRDRDDTDIRDSFLVDNLGHFHLNTRHKLEALGDNCKLIKIQSFDIISLDKDHEEIFNSIVGEIVDSTM